MKEKEKGFTPFRDFKKKSGGIFGMPQTKQTLFVSKSLPSLTGFTLIEAAVGIAIFSVLIVGVISTYSALSTLVKVNREKIQITTLADSRLEIVRNLPYSEVGTVNGNPPGNLPDFINAIPVAVGGNNYKIYYEVIYTDDPADGTIIAGTDPAPNDYKQVKMYVENVATSVKTTFVTNVSPKGLESLNEAGALRINVYNSQGLPVSDASIHIENLDLNPDLILNRQSDADGEWVEVALPESVNNYHIVVSKPGYSSDQTYPITLINPNPLKPDATVLTGQVTEVSFFIDLLSNLDILTLNQSCQNLNGVGVNVRGAKLIGTNPDVLKFNQNFSSVNGLIALPNIEWDVYTPTLLSGQGLMIYGTSPIQSIDVLPGTSQVFKLILGPETTNGLLVIVKDAATRAPLEGANVHLRKGGSEPQDYYGTTGGSVWVQYDWTGGPGQEIWQNSDQYFVDDGNIDIVSVPTGVRLKKVTGRYVASGVLESSTYDTGTQNTGYTTLTWEPTSQFAGTEVKFQIATNDDQTTWNYRGPDGAAGTYYTVSGMTISSVHSNQRYLRYKVFLSTFDDKKTPVLTSLNINYVSGCFTPGQWMFPDLTAGNNYDLDVSLPGYQTQVINNLDIFGHQTIEVLLSP